MKPFRLILLVVTTLVLTTAFGVQLAAGQSDGLVRFAHVVPGAAAVDVYVDGQLAIRELGYGSASPYIGIAAGTTTVIVTQTGVTTPLWQQTVTVTPGGAVTLIASSTQALQFTAYSDDLNALALGKTRFTAIHAVEGAPTVDLVLGDGRVVIPSLSYNQPFGTFDIDAALYSFGVVPAGGALDAAIISPAEFALNAGTSYLLVVYGTPAQPSILALAQTTRPETAGGFVRIGHGIPEAPAVDVFVDDTLIAPALAFGQATGYVALPAGSYSVVVRATGDTTDLVSASIEVQSGAYTSVFALASGGAPVLDTFTDPTSTINAGVSALTLINRLGEGDASAALDDNLVLISSVPPGSAGTAAVGAEVGAITISAGSIEQTLALPGGIYGGVHYTVLAAGDTPQIVAFAPLSVAQTVASAPGSADVVVVAPTDAPAVAALPTETPAQVVIAPTTDSAAQPQVIIVTATPTPEVAAQPEVIIVTATPTSPVVIAPTIAPTAGFVARVQLDPGVNLQLRQFPTSQALSLGLAPSNSALRVLGREGAPAPQPGATATPTLLPGAAEPTAIPDPVALLEAGQDLDRGTTWLYIVYDTPDGGTISAWVNALYIAVVNPDGRTVPLRDLPTVPRNRAGVASNTSIQPPSAAENVITVVVGNLSPGVNVHIRRTPQTAGESLALVSSGTTLEVQGLNEQRDWAFIRYVDASGGGVSGWVNLEFLSVQLNGAPTDLETLEARNLLTFTPEDTRGATFAGGIAPQAAPTVNPVRDAIIGEVRLDPGANLHLRRRPNVNAESLALIPAGTQLVVEGQSEDLLWLSVTFEGIDGWVFGSYLVLTRNGEPFTFENVPIIVSTPNATLEGGAPGIPGDLPSGEATDGEDFDEL